MIDSSSNSCGLRICTIAAIRLGETFGGVKSYIASWLSWCKTHEYTVTVLCEGGLGFPEVWHQIDDQRGTSGDGNARTRTFPYIIYMLWSLFFAVASAFHIWSLDKRLSFDLLSSQDPVYSGMATFLASRILRVPYIVHIHSDRWQRLRFSSSGRIPTLQSCFEEVVESTVIRNAACLVAVAPHIAETYARKYEDCATRIHVVMNPIPVQEIWNCSQESRKDGSLRRKYGIGQSTIVMGYVGGLDRVKNVESAVEAICTTAPLLRKVNFRFVIVGDGPARKRIEQKVDECGINDLVLLVGRSSDVYMWLGAIDIFILPSLSEGCPIALLEAMAAGKPILASGIPAISELIDRESGVIFDPADQMSIREAVWELVSRPRLRMTISRRVRVLSAKFDCETVFPVLMELYQAIADEGSSVRP